ncbi:MAG: adenosylmethionine decarboxylase [Bacteroidia bacterium]
MTDTPAHTPAKHLPLPLGRHLLVEIYEADAGLLDDATWIETQMQSAAVAAGATLVQSTFHRFSPVGVSGVVVIQESHLAIHTWPEWGYAALDIFTCGETVNPWQVFAALQRAFGSARSSAIELRRGMPFRPDDRSDARPT